MALHLSLGVLPFGIQYWALVTILPDFFVKEVRTIKSGFLKKYWLIILLLGLALCIIGLQYLSEGIYSSRLKRDEASKAIAYQSGIAEARKTGNLTKRGYVLVNGEWYALPRRFVSPILEGYIAFEYYETSKTIFSLKCNIFIPGKIRKNVENDSSFDCFSMIPESANCAVYGISWLESAVQREISDCDDAELVAYEYYRQYEISQGRTTEQYYREGRYVYSFYSEPLQAYWCTVLPDDYEERLEEPFTYAQMILDAGTGEPMYFWLEQNY